MENGPVNHLFVNVSQKSSSTSKSLQISKSQDLNGIIKDAIVRDVIVRDGNVRDGIYKVF